ncbi:MAG: hypothetical protein IMF06_14290 [Proteobacteria bacterium]|nr:hypothetical protein [Pseudomonadota bacterium]
MKSATENFGSAHAGHTPPDSPAHSSRSNRIHYILVALLLVVAYLIASFLPAAPDTVSFDIGLGFLFFWLGGGLITLTLLTLAAKH